MQVSNGLLGAGLRFQGFDLFGHLNRHLAQTASGARAYPLSQFDFKRIFDRRCSSGEDREPKMGPLCPVGTPEYLSTLFYQVQSMLAPGSKWFKMPFYNSTLPYVHGVHIHRRHCRYTFFDASSLPGIQIGKFDGLEMAAQVTSGIPPSTDLCDCKTDF